MPYLRSVLVLGSVVRACSVLGCSDLDRDKLEEGAPVPTLEPNGSSSLALVVDTGDESVPVDVVGAFDRARSALVLGEPAATDLEIVLPREVVVRVAAGAREVPLRDALVVGDVLRLRAAGEPDDEGSLVRVAAAAPEEALIAPPEAPEPPPFEGAEGDARPGFHGGADTCDHPEIGMVRDGGSCTGTLITPNIVLTSAHCFGAYSRANDGFVARAGVTFTTSASCAGARTWRARAVASSPSWMRFRNAHDIAVIFLEDEVPRAVASPRRVSTRAPSLFTGMAGYGYGATDCQIDWTPFNGHTGTNFGTKRIRTYWWGQWVIPCGGDSGGPNIRIQDGSIVGTTTGARGLYLHTTLVSRNAGWLAGVLGQCQWDVARGLRGFPGARECRTPR